MNCDCCGRKKKLFESFAKISEKNIEINLCVKCNDLMYKIRDAYNDGDKEKYKDYNNIIDNHKKDSKNEFIEWKKHFIDSLGKPSPEKAMH